MPHNNSGKSRPKPDPGDCPVGVPVPETVGVPVPEMVWVALSATLGVCVRPPPVISDRVDVSVLVATGIGGRVFVGTEVGERVWVGTEVGGGVLVGAWLG